MLDLFDNMLWHFARHATHEAIEARLNAMAVNLGEEPFCRRVAREIVNRTRPQQAVPEAYAQYKSIDVAAEQGLLMEAANVYGALTGIAIPERLPLSTGTATAMTYLEGSKINF